jgi:hypothetical protein
VDSDDDAPAAAAANANGSPSASAAAASAASASVSAVNGVTATNGLLSPGDSSTRQRLPLPLHLSPLHFLTTRLFCAAGPGVVGGEAATEMW